MTAEQVAAVVYHFAAADPGPVPEVEHCDGCGSQLNSQGDCDVPGCDGLPPVVEPETAAITSGTTTLHLSPDTAVQVAPEPDTGRVWLTMRSAGTAVTATLYPDQVDTLCDALAMAAPVPMLPDVAAIRAEGGRA